MQGLGWSISLHERTTLIAASIGRGEDAVEGARIVHEEGAVNVDR